MEERTKRVEAREGGLRGVDAGRPLTRKKERSWKKSSERERERESKTTREAAYLAVRTVGR